MFVLLFGALPSPTPPGRKKGRDSVPGPRGNRWKPRTSPRLSVPTLSRTTARSPSGALVADRLLPPVVAVSSTGYSPLLPLVNRDLRRSRSDPDYSLTEVGLLRRVLEILVVSDRSLHGPVLCGNVTDAPLY